jgi:hypothetical protein
MKKYFAYILTVGGSAWMLSSCEHSELQKYNAENAVNFSISQVEYSFLGNTSGAYIQAIPVRILGDTANHLRTFTVEVVRDTVTTAPDSLYEIIGGEVPAGSFTGTLNVKVKDAAALKTSRVAINLRLKRSADFAPGNLETSTCKLQWSGLVVIPKWTPYYAAYFVAQPSTKAYQLVVQTTGMKTFTATDYRNLTPTGAEAMGRVFGDYVKQWNKDHPDNILKHDDGVLAGQPIVPIYYSNSKYD